MQQKYEIYLANLGVTVPVHSINEQERTVVVKRSDIPEKLWKGAGLNKEFIVYWYGDDAGGNNLTLLGYNATPTRKPKLGMVVVYNHPGSADGKFPAKQSPALIQRVNADGTLELVVFSVYGGIFFNHNVEIGNGASQCNFIE